MKLYYQQPGTAAAEIEELCKVAHAMAVRIQELNEDREFMQQLANEIQQLQHSVEIPEPY